MQDVAGVLIVDSMVTVAQAVLFGLGCLLVGLLVGVFAGAYWQRFLKD